MNAVAASHHARRAVARRLGRGVTRLGRRVRGLPADADGQAMTEFVIIIPIVLIAFFAVMQIVIIGEVVQYCNYAAYAAARSYATSYAKFQGENNPNPHRAATARARCVAAMAVAPVSHGMNYMFMFPGDAQPFTTGELSAGMVAARGGGGTANTDDALRQQLLEGFAVAFVYRIEGFRITGPVSDKDPRGTVDCQFTYRIPLAVPGLASLWNYLQRVELQQNIQSPRLEDDSNFAINNPLTDDNPFVDPFLAGRELREFDPAGMLAEYQDVLESWHTPNNPGLANTLVVTYSQYLVSRGSGPVPATVRIGAKARVGFEPLLGDRL